MSRFTRALSPERHETSERRRLLDGEAELGAGAPTIQTDQRELADLSNDASDDENMGGYCSPGPTGRLRRLLGLSSRHKQPRMVRIGRVAQPDAQGRVERPQTYPRNVVRNQKYHAATFLPVVLYEQFRFFFNMFFLLVALSQLVPVLRVGFLFTYIAPLVLVLSITISKEAVDDLARARRDAEANSQLYRRLRRGGDPEWVPSSDLRVGDLIEVMADRRVPADCVLLHTSNAQGTAFVRTDQLDGETDWKLRRAVNLTQKWVGGGTEEARRLLPKLVADLWADAPTKDIYAFVGKFSAMVSGGGGKWETEGVDVDNTMWANTVVASDVVIGLVIYTGADTRAVMNTTPPTTKTSTLDLELNYFSKILFALLVVLSLLMVALKGFQGLWPVFFFRFLILFSSIIPISLRVNLDVGKMVYDKQMRSDPHIPGTIVRTSTLPEELGRLSYLFTDKTGTLTRNEMIFTKLHVGSMIFAKETRGELAGYTRQAYDAARAGAPSPAGVQRDVAEAILALALCHNVTPSAEGGYQASSPDEIALVKFAESVGLRLTARSLHSITLTTPLGDTQVFTILSGYPLRCLLLGACDLSDRFHRHFPLHLRVQAHGHHRARRGGRDLPVHQGGRLRHGQDRRVL